MSLSGGAVPAGVVVALGRFLVVAVMLVVLAACSKSESEPLVSASTTPVTTDGATTAQAATSTSTSTTTPTTKATTATLPAATDLAATSVPTNEEWVKILQELHDRIDVMYADPAHADVGSACAIGSECERRYSTQLGDMSNQNVHYEDYPHLKVLSVESVDEVAATSDEAIAPGTIYEITYTAQAGDFSNARVVDANGNVVADLSPAPGDPTIKSGTRVLTWNGQDPSLPWRFTD